MHTHRFRRFADVWENRLGPGAGDGCELPALPATPVAVVALPIPAAHPLYQLYRWAYEQAQHACVQRRFQRAVWTSEN